MLFIAMRLVDGEDLAGLLSREGPLDPVRAARLSRRSPTRSTPSTCTGSSTATSSRATS